MAMSGSYPFFKTCIDLTIRVCPIGLQPQSPLFSPYKIHGLRYIAVRINFYQKQNSILHLYFSDGGGYILGKECIADDFGLEKIIGSPNYSMVAGEKGFFIQRDINIKGGSLWQLGNFFIAKRLP